MVLYDHTDFVHVTRMCHIMTHHISHGCHDGLVTLSLLSD